MINHATLEVPRDLLDEEVRWWTYVMRFSEEDPYSDRYGARWIYRWVDLGEHSEVPRARTMTRAQIHLFPVPHNGDAAAWAEIPEDFNHPHPKAIIPTYGHMAFVVGDDLDALIKRQHGFGTGKRAEEGSRYWGTRRYMIATPAGHRVEVMETGPQPANQRR